jgi:hypothetical protein
VDSTTIPAWRPRASQRVGDGHARRPVAAREDLGARRARRQHRDGPPPRDRALVARARRDLGHEAIADSRNGLDEAALLSQGLAQRRDVDREDAFLDDHVGPDPAEQVRLGDESSRAAYKRHEEVERLRRQHDRPSAPEQPPLGHVERETGEDQELPVRHGV